MDSSEVALVKANAQIIAPYVSSNNSDPSSWWEGGIEEDQFSRSGKVLHSSIRDDANHYGGTACIFLRGDHKCALQLAGENAGYHPWHFKPFYCILHPLDLDEQGRITLDNIDALLDEPGSCLRPSAEEIPLLVTFEEELRYLLGDAAYNRLITDNS